MHESLATRHRHIRRDGACGATACAEPSFADREGEAFDWTLVFTVESQYADTFVDLIASGRSVPGR
jgi:hypothetical protein